MNLRQLEYFVSVAETLSFTKTAKVFFISQTAVTQQIKALEKQLDAILLNRTKRHVALTPAGSVFLSEAKAILARTENAIKRVQETATGFTGKLNLGIVEGYEDPKIPDIIRSFRARYPNVSLSICEGSVGQLYNALIDQELDEVLNVNPHHAHLENHDISYQTIAYYHPVVLLHSAHPLAFRNELDLSELKNDSFIFTSIKQWDDYAHYESILEHFIQAGFLPKVIQTSDSFRITSLMVAANIGIAIIPSFALASSPTLTANHVTVPLNDKADKIEVVAAHHNQNTNPSINKFLSYFNKK